jgi:hypothetical protein
MADFIANCKRALSGGQVRHERLVQFDKTLYWCDITYNSGRNERG